MEDMNEEEKNIIDRMQGKWYEQCANADVITIEKDHITYEYDGESTSGAFGVRRSEDDENEWNIGTGGGFKAKWSGFERLVFYSFGEGDLDYITTRMNMIVYDMQYSPRQFERKPRSEERRVGKEC